MGEHRPVKGARRKPVRAPAPIPASTKVTVRHIARAAGVSVATVSRVLNTPNLVTADKREAVLGALRSHDYIPNQSARSLISRRSRAIGLIVPTLSNPVFASTMAAIEREVGRMGYALLISCCERDPQREFAQARTLIERGVDGLLITGSEHLAELPELLARYKVPYVSQDISLARPMGPSVALDNAGALGTAVDYLYALGHRGIAVFSGPTHNTPPIRDRFDSAVARIRHHGLAIPEEWRVATEDYDSHSIRIAAQRLFEGVARPTAVVLTGDILALGVVAECRARGLDVPRDISIVGCGDTAMGRYVDPPLTTVSMPFEEMGAVAASSLLALIGGQAVEDVRVLSHALVVRDSAGPPPGGRSS